MNLERNHIAFQIFLKLLAKEKLYGSFLHNEMEKINEMVELAYKASDLFIKESEKTSSDSCNNFNTME